MVKPAVNKESFAKRCKTYLKRLNYDFWSLIPLARIVVNKKRIKHSETKRELHEEESTCCQFCIDLNQEQSVVLQLRKFATVNHREDIAYFGVAYRLALVID